ncbi:hypothetical protein Q4E40_01635 [Pontibacter sp. BT731]|uniref:hypothetical protein n=1 Tax=Pontibacter coccineus TaxID=3063328 RepID=UPI0026E3B2D0|nr:hypothetical protein [Pontibacter sp. BT731]MDO6388809.1 hypothetical protein [Pontibacter sp. BT731]
MKRPCHLQVYAGLLTRMNSEMGIEKSPTVNFRIDKSERAMCLSAVISKEWRDLD